MSSEESRLIRKGESSTIDNLLISHAFCEIVQKYSLTENCWTLTAHVPYKGFFCYNAELTLVFIHTKKFNE